MVLGLATTDFFTFFFESAPLAPANTKHKQTQTKYFHCFVQNYVPSSHSKKTHKLLCNDVALYECLLLVFSTTSSSKSSSKISLPSSTYPVPSEGREEKLLHQTPPSHTHKHTSLTAATGDRDSPSSMIQSSSCLSRTIFEYCCSSTSSYTLVNSSTWKT